MIVTRPEIYSLQCVCDNTTEHMTQHNEYLSESIQTMFGHTLPQDNGLNWLFHPDRTDNVYGARQFGG